MKVAILETKEIKAEKIINLYKANKWSSSEKPTADGRSIDFYKKIGFEKAGKTQPMWIYNGDEH